LFKQGSRFQKRRRNTKKKKDFYFLVGTKKSLK